MKCPECKRKMIKKCEIKREPNGYYYCIEYFYCKKCEILKEDNQIRIGQEIIVRG